MAKKLKINAPDNPEFQLTNGSSDSKKCILKFSMCHGKYPLWNLQKEDLKEFIKFAKKVENMEWKDIKKDRGLRYEVLDDFERPDTISNDVTIRSMRLSIKSRVIGYKQDEFFYIVWFDNTHKTC